MITISVVNNTAGKTGKKKAGGEQGGVDALLKVEKKIENRESKCREVLATFTCIK